MLTKKMLENINDSMLKRNKVSGSMIGYNYTDKKSCELYQNGITDQQALTLCSKLKKYANKQLDVTEQEILDTENYYKNLINSSNDRLFHERPFVNIRMLGEDYSYITFKYNKPFILAVKSYDGVWIPDDIAWKIRNENVESVLFDLEEQGGNVTGALMTFKENHHMKTLVI